MNLEVMATEALEGRRSYKKLVKDTLSEARKIHPTMKSFHEGLAIIMEEFEEFKAEIFKKQQSKLNIILELAQISAMCQRFAEDLRLASLDD
jgi:hypothetical protein